MQSVTITSLACLHFGPFHHLYAWAILPTVTTILPPLKKGTTIFARQVKKMALLKERKEKGKKGLRSLCVTNPALS